jgi:phage terminase large subunit
MVVQAVAPSRGTTDVRIVTEIRGAPARLWDEASGEIIIAGPAGTGKTRAILEYVHRRCSEERLRVLFLRKTAESLKASALVTFQEQVLHKFDGRTSVMDGVVYFGGNNLRPAEFTYLATGSKIVIAGIDQPTKVKSTEWDIVFVNEATELTLDDWETLTGRTDRPSMFEKPPSVVIGDCNPDAPTHWIKQRDTLGSLRLWHSVHKDNPAMWDRIRGEWTPSGLTYMARLDSLTGVRYQRLRLGKWVAAEGQIFEGFDAGVHIIDSWLGMTRQEVAKKPEWSHFWDVDFGFTNPFVWHDWVLAPDGELILVDEIYRTQVLVEDHAVNITERTRERPRPRVIIVDHDAEDRATLTKKTGMPTRKAIKDVSPGLQAVASRLKVGDNGKPRIVLFRDACPYQERDRALIERGKPSCTADEFPTYIWDTRMGVKRGESPLKDDDHGMDALRYQVMYHDAGRAKGYGFS